MEIPYDEDLPRSEREGKSPFEFARKGAAVEAISRLADILIEE